MVQKKFKDFIKLQRGFDLPKKDREEGKYPVVASTSITGYHNEFKVTPPGVTTGRSGSLGQVLYLDQKFWPLNTTLWVKDFKGNLPLYVYYFLKTLNLQEYNSGAGVPTLNRNHLDGLDIEIHEPYRQQKIASILSAFDDLIENNTRRIVLLEEMTRLIYREWFVHYRYPGHEEDELVDSGTEFVEIPEGWDFGTIGDLYNVKSGFAFKSKKLVDKGSFGVIKIGNIQSGDIDVKGVQFIENDEVPDRARKFKLVPGDILIAMTGAKVGKVGIMPKTENPYYLNQRVGKYFPKNDLFKSHMYLYIYLNSIEAQTNISHLAQGAAQPNISATDLKSLKLAIPPKEILKSFEELTLSMRDEMLILRQKNVKLEETRDLLLPRLILGKLNKELF